jgi:DNA polymerase-3 subunit epsilon
MDGKLYAVVDLETTGGRASRDRIIEVGIVLHDGRQVVQTFETLINPECSIPYGITQLTGITQEMVQDAPRFYEVAKEIVELTEKAVFVAHNVRFDYSFLREEFRRLGYTYTRKTLCTVRLSRKAFPGLPSYSLGNLIKHFDISVADRHRAMADTLATTQLLEMILQQEEGSENINDLVNMGIREALLPKAIDMERIHGLPEECGVYYFHDNYGQVVYVGKSKNIKKRVATHFAKKTHKASLLQKHVADISFELTGSELVALLLESYEIKRLAPPINRAQRQKIFPYFIHYYHDPDGYLVLDVEKQTKKNRKELAILAEYPKLSSAKGHMNAILTKFELCSKFLRLEKSGGPCFRFHLKQCRGACAGHESPEDYNDRVMEAMEYISTVLKENFFLLDQGRTEDEHAIVLVEEGAFQGFGYCQKEDLNGNLDQLRDAIRPFGPNPETKRIIRRFLAGKQKVKQIKF